MSFEKSVLGMALRATGPRHVEARLQEFLAGFSPLGTAPYSTHLSCTLHAHPSPELIGKMEICQQIGNPLYYYQAMKVYEVPNKTNQRLYGDGTSYLLLDMEAKTLEGYISEQTAGRDFFLRIPFFPFRFSITSPQPVSISCTPLRLPRQVVNE